MSSGHEAWFETRPRSAPPDRPPTPPPGIVAIARALDGTAEVRIAQRGDGLCTFEIEAWTNFEDAGGQPHLQWHTFYPPHATRTDSLDRAIELALADAAERGLAVGAIEYLQADSGT